MTHVLFSVVAGRFHHGEGFLYVCPELILHYIAVLWYLPPAEFCAAVMNCPPTRTMEYKRAYLANGGREFARQTRR